MDSAWIAVCDRTGGGCEFGGLPWVAPPSPPILFRCVCCSLVQYILVLAVTGSYPDVHVRFFFFAFGALGSKPLLRFISLRVLRFWSNIYACWRLRVQNPMCTCDYFPILRDSTPVRRLACLCGFVFHVSIRWVIGRSRLSRFRSSGGLSSGWRHWAGRQNSVAPCDVELCSAGWRFASRWCD